MSNVIKAHNLEAGIITFNISESQQKYFISDILTRINKVIFELEDDSNYTKEHAISDLSKLAQMLDSNYPR